MGQHDKERAVHKVVFRISLGFLILIIFSYLLSSTVSKLKAYDSIVDGVHFTSALLGIVLQVARERGLTSIWLASNGTSGYAQMLHQRAETDGVINGLRGMSAGHEGAVASLLNVTQDLPSLRSRVDQLKMTSEASLDAFTQINHGVLSLAGSFAKDYISPAAMARFYLAEVIEAKGLLRGTLGVVFQVGYWPSGELARRVLGIRGRVEVYMQEALRYVTPAQTDHLHDLLSLNATSFAIAQANQFLSLALSETNASAAQPFGLSPSAWFNSSTTEIQALSAYFQDISQDAIDSAALTRWWDLAVLTLGLLLEAMCLVEMAIALWPVLSITMRWSDFSFANTTTSSPTASRQTNHPL